jgi:7,8-dihydropterin-6-yl-methyl-4-(beta-D-ribofuranosyl)aminobenzene 5'-phosphate synthase
MALTAAAAFQPPTVESLSVRLVVDSYHDIFMPKAEHPFCRIEHVARMPGRERETFACEWGLSLHLESKLAGQRHQYLLDFGFTPEVLNRNFDLLGIEPDKLDGLILSHSHRDHYGGMVGFVDRYRPEMRDDLKLYTGAGNITFREKWAGARGGDPVPMGALDGEALASSHVETVCCEHAHALDGAFTSGPIAWQSFEKVTPTTLVEPTPLDHFTEAERRGRLVLDKHPDEHATCYVVQGRGLVVISSCGHCGIVNTVKTAQAVSGVEKVHAVIGGFHLGAAPADYIAHTVAELQALQPDVVVPMHCTGRPFIDAVLQAMPQQVVLSSTGSRFTFGV